MGRAQYKARKSRLWRCRARLELPCRFIGGHPHIGGSRSWSWPNAGRAQPGTFFAQGTEPATLRNLRYQLTLRGIEGARVGLCRNPWSWPIWGVYSVHTSGIGSVRISAGSGRIPHVSGGVQCLRGRECSSSPTSGTVFPQVKGLFLLWVLTNPPKVLTAPYRFCVASIRKRTKKDGTSSYMVLWRDPKSREQQGLTRRDYRRG